MNLKKYLIEQADSQKMAVLEKVIESGCLQKNYPDFEMDPGPQPNRIKIGEPPIYQYAIIGKLKSTGEKILFMNEFGDTKQAIINLTEAQKPEGERNEDRLIRTWVCEEKALQPTQTLSDDQNEYLRRLENIGWTRTKRPQMDLDTGDWLAFNLVTGKKYNGEDATEPIYNEVKKYVNYFSNLKSPILVYKVNPSAKGYEEVDRADCRQTIEKLYDLYEKQTGSIELINQLVKKTQTCLNQKNFQINPFLKKKIDTLTNINANHPVFAKYKVNIIKTESISKRIKQTLIETKEQKNNLLIERKIVESRLKFIVEDLDKFNSFSKNKKIKTGFRFLQEMNYFQKVGLLQEELGSTLKQIFGQSLDAVVGNVADPFLNSILNKLGLSNELQIKIIDSLKNKSQEIINHMNSCKELSKFLTDEIIEVITTSMNEGEIFGSSLIDKAVLASMKEDTFKIKLSDDIEMMVCEAFNKFTENAKNLVTKLTPM